MVSEIGVWGWGLHDIVLEYPVAVRDEHGLKRIV